MSLASVNETEMFDLDLALTMPELYDQNDSAINRNCKADEYDQSRRPLAVQMPTVAIGVEGGGQSQCAVCVEGFRLGAPARQIPCGHVFHENCISGWLSINNSCPLCRQIPAPSFNF